MSEANTVKYLTEDGVRILWAMIEQKFMDASEVNAAVSAINIPEVTDPDALTAADLASITGVTLPQENNDDSGDNGDNGDPNNGDPEPQEEQPE